MLRASIESEDNKRIREGSLRILNALLENIEGALSDAREDLNVLHKDTE